MAKDSTFYAKAAGITALQNAAAVLALVPADRVWPVQTPPNPAWPYVNWGVSDSAPFGASCLDGSTISVRVHCWARTGEAGGGEDIAHAINAAVQATLDGAAIDLAAHDCPYPATAHYTVTAAQVVRDGGEVDKFHGIVSLRIDVSS